MGDFPLLTSNEGDNKHIRGDNNGGVPCAPNGPLLVRRVTMDGRARRRAQCALAASVAAAVSGVSRCPSARVCFMLPCCERLLDVDCSILRPRGQHEGSRAAGGWARAG